MPRGRQSAWPMSQTVESPLCGADKQELPMAWTQSACKDLLA